MASNGQGFGSSDSEPWFYGRITRDESERLLQPPCDGLFLVRESEHYRGDFTLSISCAGKVEHYRIHRQGVRLTIDEELSFRDLPELVEHYKQDADGLCTRLIRHPRDLTLSFSEFDDNLRIDFRDIDIRDLIGKGEFSEVYKAHYQGQSVAAKRIKCEGDAHAIVDEVKLMRSLNHKHLVQMLGVAYDGKSLFIVTEFMSKGSLVDYLRTRGRALITAADQLKFAKHTCVGMVYLEGRHIVHRDLAARNVLIDEYLNAKVADFGLARSTEDKLAVSKLPIKWTAPEALKDSSKFTSKSDVWSFGVLLWEIYSFGRVPYPKMPLNEVLSFVEEGGRMEKPEGCPPEVHNIMKDAWREEPAARPTFAKIHERLGVLTSTPV